MVFMRSRRAKGQKCDIVKKCQVINQAPCTARTTARNYVTSGGGKLFVLSDVACCIRCGIRILGTSVEAIDACEDRNKFSQLCDRLRVDQPEWSEFATLEDTQTFAYQCSG